MTVAAPQYVVEFEGNLYGPFITNDMSVPANQELTDDAITDAQWWAAQNNLGSAPVLILRAPNYFQPPIPEADTTG